MLFGTALDNDAVVSGLERSLKQKVSDGDLTAAIVYVFDTAYDKAYSQPARAAASSGSSQSSSSQSSGGSSIGVILILIVVGGLVALFKWVFGDLGSSEGSGSGEGSGSTYHRSSWGSSRHFSGGSSHRSSGGSRGSMGSSRRR